MLCQRSLAIFFIVNVPIVTCLEPDFLNPMENITVPKGRDATFTCVVNHLGGYRVSPSSSASGDHGGANPRVAWIKANTRAVLAIHEHVITNNARLSVTHNDANTWTLSIKDAHPEDRGTYMCQVNTNPMKSQSAHLEVVIPPDIIYEETSGDIMVPEGGSAKLVCKARGYPKPEIVWKREDGSDIITRTHSGSKTKVLTAQGEILSFPNVGRSEMGAYLCIASNGVRPTVSKRMMLQVHFRPLIEVPNQLVGAPIRTDVTLSCKVEASPKPINYWTRENGEMIISNDKYAMSEEISNMYSAWMQLIVRDLQARDFGGYKCISKNSLGDAESGIRLYEIALQERKHEHHNGGSSNNEYETEERELSNRLNHVYQGSLRESGSTLRPRSNASANGSRVTQALALVAAIFTILMLAEPRA
ncbi:PREDICTED: lachesin-like [Ceratosolen solmsi marchali]|uniref:Lachesin-like n=1 Tax=Ceratosolen solmsi marchali TaxID=326594 RepID=A0AAJ6YM66_9HYME|nr:PREDICTED: lachesin-like [Ceratosolen solmsi marchali]